MGSGNHHTELVRSGRVNDEDPWNVPTRHSVGQNILDLPEGGVLWCELWLRRTHGKDQERGDRPPVERVLFNPVDVGATRNWDGRRDEGAWCTALQR